MLPDRKEPSSGGVWDELCERVGPVLWLNAYRERLPYRSQDWYIYLLGVVGGWKKWKGAWGLLSNIERGGGAEQRRHVPHHLFAQRPYSNPTLVPRFGKELQLLSKIKRRKGSFVFRCNAKLIHVDIRVRIMKFLRMDSLFGWCCIKGKVFGICSTIPWILQVSIFKIFNWLSSLWKGKIFN